MPGKGARLAVAAARIAVHCGIAACVGAFAAWLILAATTTIKSSTAIKENLKVSNLSGSNMFCILMTCASLLGATLLTLVLRLSGARDPAPRASSIRLAQVATKAKRLLSWQMPPRAFFAGWCGGLSVAEALSILLWLGLNAWWLGNLTSRALKDGMTWVQQAEKLATIFGKMMAPNLMLLFLPVPHCSFITHLTGVSRNALIRYHRWLGHGTLWVLTVHAVLYYIVWGVKKEFWVEFKAWDGKVNNLAGSLAYFFVLALWGSSLEFVRRRMYQLFFRFHIICFFGFFMFSLVHYVTCWTYFAPGLLLYAVDLALRSGQLASVTPVVAASVDENAGVATLRLKADPALSHKPLSEIWLMVPEVSRWAWHPFTVASGGGQFLTVHMKRYGAFTRSVLEGLKHCTISGVRVIGPHGAGEMTVGCQLSPPDSFRRYDTVVMIGGGVGITALMSVLRCIAAERSAGRLKGLPSKVTCVWTARGMGDFHALDSGLLQAATEAGGWLDLRLHLTGGSTASRKMGNAASGDAGSIDGSSSTGSLGKESSFASGKESSSAPPSRSSTFKGAFDAEAEVEDAALLPSRAPSGASPYFLNLLRPVQPQSFGVAHLAAVNILTFVGAFCAVLLSAAYNVQVDQWKGGFLYSVLMPAVGLGLPFALAVFPVHAWRYWRACKAAKQGGKASIDQWATPYSHNNDLLDAACYVGNGCVSLGDSSLAVQQGRPDVAALLQTAAAEAGAGGVVGVYAGGPKPLMTGVHLAVSRLNAAKAGAYLELHREAVEL